MNSANKWLAAALGLLLLLQFRSLQNQGEMEQQVQSLSQQVSQQGNSQQSQLGSLRKDLSEMAEAERWIAVRQQELGFSSTCESAEAQLEWELLQWAPETTSRLLYRMAGEAVWKEAEVRSLGGQNYAAAFPVSAKPTLQLGVSISSTGTRSAEAPVATESLTKESRTKEAKEKESPHTLVEYQVLAEGPGYSRSTGARLLPYGGLVIPGSIDLHLVKDLYTVQLSTEGSRRTSCFRLESAEVRAYVGERLVSTSPLTVQGQDLWAVEWQSQEPLTRLEVIIRHSDGEEVRPISLPGR